MNGLLLLVAAPVAAGLAAAVDPRRGRRLVWLVLGAALHLGLLGFAWGGRPSGSRLLWLAFDPLGGLVITLVSVVFLAVALYSAGYLGRETPRGGRAYEVCLLGFLASATVICLTDHFGALWVAMEATTLATAPLIYDPDDHHSIEAVWKYLLICSVGIALALLGTFLLALAQGAPGSPPDLLRSTLLSARSLNPVWFKAAFVFLFVGYGTKVGLVPMHTWLPDAHGEAPSPISALLSGALLNLAFLSILRVAQVGHATGFSMAMAPVLIGFGLGSVLVATALLLRQRNYKRMLAYSSIEHMGILALGCGLGHAAGFGALLHMLGSALCKALLFLVAGNVLIEYRSKRVDEVTGMLRRIPGSGLLLLAGFLVLTGAPPFPLFFSELAILRGALQAGHPWVAIALVALQLVAFVALGVRIVAMVQGTGSDGAPRARESGWLLAPPAGLLAAALALGLMPAVQSVLAAAATTLAGSMP
jgi:hydrogenase-4 component F